jgi:hypothetical protein
MKIDVCEFLRSTALAMTTLALALSAQAQYSSGVPSNARDPKGFYFQHKDWELACDNTRTCRAAGYPTDENVSGDSLASVLLTRQAGPSTDTSIQFKAQNGQAGDEFKGKFDLRIDSVKAGTFEFDKDLPASSAKELLPKLLAGKKVELVQGKKTLPISLAGLGAVALKMDDVQKRVGTTGAMATAARGSKTEAFVMTPLGAPTITVPKLPAQSGLDKVLFDPLRKAIGKTECTAIEPTISIHQLNDRQVLLEIEPCHTAAYNAESAYYLANIKAPHAPKLVVFDGPANGYAHGVITGMHKGRGIGDCMSTASYAWDGTRFAKASAQGSGMCKGFMGGAWDMPTVETKLVNPNEPVATAPQKK